MRGGSRSCSRRGEPRFWVAALLVFVLLVYAGVRLIPPRAPSLPQPTPVEVEGVVVPLELSRAGPLDLNRATVEELMGLPGIGPALAARIVAFREEHGPFTSVEELLQVPGIGEATLEALRPYVTVQPP